MLRKSHTQTQTHTHSASLDGGSAKSARVGWRCGAFFNALVLLLMHFVMCFSFLLLLSLTFFLLFRVIAVDNVLRRVCDCGLVCECMCGNWRFASHSDTSFELFAHIWFFDILHNHVRVAVGKLARNSEGKKMISHCVELRVHRHNADCGERERKERRMNDTFFCYVSLVRLSTTISVGIMIMIIVVVFDRTEREMEKVASMAHCPLIVTTSVFGFM